MAMQYYTQTFFTQTAGFVCNGCGAVMAYYSRPSTLNYGI